MLTPYLEMRALLRILHVVKAKGGRHPNYLETVRDLREFIGCKGKDILEWDAEQVVIPGSPGFDSDAVREHFRALLKVHGYPPIETILNCEVHPKYLLSPLQEKKILVWIHRWLEQCFFVLDHVALIHKITQECDLSADDEEAVRSFVYTFVLGARGGIPEAVERARALLEEHFGVVLPEHSSPVPLCEQKAEPAAAFTQLHEIFIGSHFFGPSPYKVLAIRARLALMQAKGGSPEDRVELERILGDAENAANGLYVDSGDRHQRWVVASHEWQEIERRCRSYEPDLDEYAACSEMIQQLLHGCPSSKPTDFTGEAHNDNLHRFISESERLGKRRI